MQNQTLKDFVLMAIPSEVLEEAQIMPNALIQYHADEGKIIMEMVDEVLPLACSGECDDCPVSTLDCDGDCKNCPCHINCDDNNEEPEEYFND